MRIHRWKRFYLKISFNFHNSGNEEKTFQLKTFLFTLTRFTNRKRKCISLFLLIGLEKKVYGEFLSKEVFPLHYISKMRNETKWWPNRGWIVLKWLVNDESSFKNVFLVNIKRLEKRTKMNRIVSYLKISVSSSFLNCEAAWIGSDFKLPPL